MTSWAPALGGARGRRTRCHRAFFGNKCLSSGTSVGSSLASQPRRSLMSAQRRRRRSQDGSWWDSSGTFRSRQIVANVGEENTLRRTDRILADLPERYRLDATGPGSPRSVGLTPREATFNRVRIPPRARWSGVGRARGAGSRFCAVGQQIGGIGSSSQSLMREVTTVSGESRAISVPIVGIIVVSRGSVGSLVRVGRSRR